MKKIFCIIFLLSFFSILIYSQNSAPKADIIKNFVIYEEKGKYCAWPNVVMADNGDLLVGFCRAEEHHSPTGEAMLITSTDKGESWQNLKSIADTPLDDGTVSFIKLNDGKIILLQFSRVFPTKLFEEDFVKLNAYPAETLKRWTAHTKSKEYNEASKSSGWHCATSADNGKTWSELIKICDAYRNGIDLGDGTIMTTGYFSNNCITVNRTDSKQASWNWEIDTLRFPDFKNLSFAEPAVSKLNSGRIIMMIRSVAVPYGNSDRRNLLWETYSDDNGKTWIEPYPTPIWGYPAEILQLKDGRVMISYSYRREPFGQRVCFSDDGITWKHENELILRDDGPNEDLGYPSSVEIEPGKILTVYYQPNVPKGTVQEMKPPDPGRVKPGILGTIWKVPMKK